MNSDVYLLRKSPGVKDTNGICDHKEASRSWGIHFDHCGLKYVCLPNQSAVKGTDFYKLRYGVSLEEQISEEL